MYIFSHVGAQRYETTDSIMFDHISSFKAVKFNKSEPRNKTQFTQICLPFDIKVLNIHP